MASGSIAQVHKAVLDGVAVAVKVSVVLKAVARCHVTLFLNKEPQAAFSGLIELSYL